MIKKSKRRFIVNLIEKLKALSGDASESATDHARKVGAEIHPGQVKICQEIGTLIGEIKVSRDNFKEETEKARLDQNKSNRETELVDTDSLRKLISIIDKTTERILGNSKTGN